MLNGVYIIMTIYINGAIMIITPKEQYEKLTKGSEKKVKLKCDDCGHISETNFSNYFKTQIKNGNTGKTYCRICSNIRSGIRKRGSPSPFKGRNFPERCGKNHKCWKGGSYLSIDGYRMVMVTSGRMKSGWRKYRKEHIVLIEEKIGRRISKSECVHHIDGDKLNNDISNLVLLNHKKHRNSHHSIQKLGYELVKKGYVKYNKDTNEYYFSEEMNEFVK